MRHHPDGLRCCDSGRRFLRRPGQQAPLFNRDVNRLHNVEKIGINAIRRNETRASLKSDSS